MCYCRGTAISKIVARNTLLHPEKFEKDVKMWVFEELIGNRKLSEIINEEHENVKYVSSPKLAQSWYINT
jgi:glycerol-3-phosphate dehydrogenase (NAD+)